MYIVHLQILMVQFCIQSDVSRLIITGIDVVGYSLWIRSYRDRFCCSVAGPEPTSEAVSSTKTQQSRLCSHSVPQDGTQGSCQGSRLPDCYNI